MQEIVNQSLNPDILNKACLLYGIPPEQIKLIRSNSNLIYDCGDKILRLSHASIRATSDIEAEVEWMWFLRTNGCPIANIFPSIKDSDLEQIEAQGTHFTAVCFEKIKGTTISKSSWGTAHFAALGSLCGILHRVGGDFPKQSKAVYKHWDEIEEFSYYKNLPIDDRNLPELHDQLVREIKALPIKEDNYGLIHYDIHRGNYLIKTDGKIALFDFEMACTSWYINDIAAVLYYALHTLQPKPDFEAYFLNNFWKGYEQENTLATTERKNIPTFLLYRDLMVLGYLEKIWLNKNLSEAEIRYKKSIEESIAIRRKLVL